MRIILVLLLLISFDTAAEPAKPYTIERSEVVTIRSNLLKRSYDLFIKLPRSYKNNTTEKYPVLFLSDAGYSFPLVSSISRQMSGFGKTKEIIIVGISYSKGDRWDVSRTRDYTPTNSPNEEIGHSEEAKKASGGANEYLNFISTELFSYIKRNYRADMTNKIYAGHSFGALFGGYVIKISPDTFESYILSDPSFWYGDEAIFGINSEAAKGTVANVLIVSANSGIPPEKGSFPHNMLVNAKRFEHQLLSYLGTGSIVKMKTYNGQIHETIFPIALSQGLLEFAGK
jgi:predicted alpha/beta superfamily hydrolase